MSHLFIRFIFIFSTLFLAPSFSHASIINISATQDAFVNSGNPNTNYGEASILRVGRADSSHVNLGASRGTRFAYMFFDLSMLSPQSFIHQAGISFFQNDSHLEPGGVRIYSITSGWSETDITWNNRPSVGQALFQTGTLPSGGVGQYSHLNLTNLIQSWIQEPSNNFGLFFSLVDSSGGDTLLSKESAIAPSLTLDITDAHPVPEPSKIMFLGLVFLVITLRKRVLKTLK